jgi:hypothetical protein
VRARGGHWEKETQRHIHTSISGHRAALSNRPTQFGGTRRAAPNCVEILSGVILSQKLYSQTRVLSSQMCWLYSCMVYGVWWPTCICMVHSITGTAAARLRPSGSGSGLAGCWAPQTRSPQKGCAPRTTTAVDDVRAVRAAAPRAPRRAAASATLPPHTRSNGQRGTCTPRGGLNRVRRRPPDGAPVCCGAG